MKKYIFIGAALCLAAASTIACFLFIIPRIKGNAVDDAIRMEDAIIVHGIKMETDTPPSDGDDESEGQVIVDDSFDDAIIDYDKLKKQARTSSVKKEMKEFESLKAKDRRWHLRRHKIRKMDNLWKIARRYGVHQRVIISINGISNPNMLKPGRHINVPTRNGIYYQVMRGDNVSSIAKRYRIAVKSIAVQNNLGGRVIRPGQKLFLPDARELEKRQFVASRKSKPADEVASAPPMTFIWPLRGKITSGFGNRKDPFSGNRSFHCGIDISTNLGTPVHAARDGRVIFSGWKPGYGNVVIVRHEGGYISVYAHNSKNVAVGESAVKAGDMLAYSGMTGAVTGAHLHFELRKYVTPLNPMRFLR